MVTRSDILKNGRYAGCVKRYHTWPTITTQTVACHSWQVLRLYTQIFGPPSTDVTAYILWHDAGELVLGDLPFPVKARNPDLKLACDRIENEAVVAMGGFIPKLSEVEKVRCKGCDYVEMLEFGLDEVAMGNTFAQPIVDDIKDSLYKLSMSPEDWLKVENYLVRVGTCT